MTNLLEAIQNIVHSPISDLVSHYKGKNRINGVGDALEFFVKDAFAGTINAGGESERLVKYSEVFSYAGNQNNPPDLMIRGGDAVEVKKIESYGSQIALNSSYPKAKLFADDPMITSTCRNCETWTEKDIIYAIGIASNQRLNLLWLVYGDCYAAEKEIYEKTRNRLINGIADTQGVDFTVTKELGRVNKVDPLGITYLRIRGMWGIENPAKAFSYVDTGYAPSANFQMIALMKESKYASFSKESRENIEKIVLPGFSMRDVVIKAPSNPVEVLPAKVINYTR
ncbi:MAG: NgoPII family restriction endonuclease [Lyngbya sp. HA4199-MV5]|jgi:hypothetical protein|nr:NgoPII family restriction endonuclease [Lyngbya sp. HA4199-MV5]